MTTLRQRRSFAAACIAMVMLSSGPTLAAHALAAPSAVVRMRGVYANTQSGFRFDVLPGLAVFQARAPAPNHGASVVLGPTRRIEVSAAFDAPEYGSTEALLTARLLNGGVGLLHRGATNGGRVAEEASDKEGEAVHVLVVRPEGGGDDGVNYTAELTTNAASQARDRAMFHRLLATFHFVARTG